MQEKGPTWRLDRVFKTYDMGEVKVEALRKSSLSIPEGELVVILGPSGSGKSTLLNLLGGMDVPSGGDVWFRDENLSAASDRQLTLYRRNVVGFVFQFFNLIPDLTARENVDIAAELVDSPFPTEDVLDGVGMSDRIDHFPSQMSGGEQQRVAIARALVKNPLLLLCDEPTGSLDASTGRLILAQLEEINRKFGTTVVIVTHNASIADMARRVVRMSSGRIVEETYNEEPLPPERISW
ncbi:MAG: ABC transporter ATP-binding protein [Thermovirgaceae bacterium]|nr:ABC transporter ATP-binding protein [Synergistota bacterium]HPE91088.1 ABC transporter ATP-binding protein [Synergistales bacterium]